MDWDDCFKEKGNPKGNFVMIVEPLYEGVIYYRTIEDGFWIEGEGYILTGRKNILKKKVNKWIQKYKKKRSQICRNLVPSDKKSKNIF